MVRFLYMVMLGGLLACSGSQVPGTPEGVRHDLDTGVHRFTVGDEAEIHRVMADQEQAWDRGDIPGFMEGYADSVCFTSSKGTTCGKEGVTAGYQKRYPDKSAMGDLSFGSLELVPAGADHAWCTGTWQLVRTADTLGGGFSLLWQRMPEGWRILRDHTY